MTAYEASRTGHQHSKQDDDQLCMTRVIGVGLAKSCMVADETWQDIKNKKKCLTNPKILVQHCQISSSGYKNTKQK